MCTECLDLSTDEFANQRDFEEFESKIWQKCDQDKLAIVDSYQSDFNLIFESQFCYRCNNCEEVWLLSVPENAWRGFFLPEQRATEHTS